MLCRLSYPTHGLNLTAACTPLLLRGISRPVNLLYAHLQSVHQSGHGTGKTGNLVINFPDRENTGNLGTTQGKFVTTHGIFQTSLKFKYFIVNCPFIDYCTQFFSSPTLLSIFPQTLIRFMLFPHIYVRFLVWHVKLNICNEREERMAIMGW